MITLCSVLCHLTICNTILIAFEPLPVLTNRNRGRDRKEPIEDDVEDIHGLTSDKDTEIFTSNEQGNQCVEPIAILGKVPDGWPIEVRCEMNLAVWEEALHRTGLLQDFKDVLEGFVEGFDQGIPDHRIGDLKSYIPPNHSSARLAEEDIRASISLELDAGRMFGPFTKEQVSSVLPFFRTSPMGAVINGDGSLRAINDLSFPRNDPSIPSVNSFVDPKRFETTWDDFKKVEAFFRASTDPLLLAIFDWYKAYRQIPTLKSQWRYLMVLDPDGRILVDTRISFGGVAGCGSFGRPADAWKCLMLAEHDLVAIFRWVDDNLFVKRVASSTSMKDIVLRSQALGAITNKKKCSEFQYEQKFIGFIWDGFNKTVRLPEKKLQERIAQVEEFLKENSKFSRDQVEVLAGRLTHVSCLLPQLRCYLNSLYRWIHSWVHLYSRQLLPVDARDDLLFWKDSLSSFKNSRLIASAEPKDIQWVGDASTSFGIGVLIGDRWSQFRLKGGWDVAGGIKRGIAWLETVAIRLGLLMLLCLDVRPGQNLVVWTDNTTSESTVRKRKSRDLSVNEEWKLIQQLLIQSQLDITPKRVISSENKADALSRGVTTGHTENHRLTFPLPYDLRDMLEICN